MPPTVENITPLRALRINEAVRLTGLGRSTLYRAMAAGRLRSLKVGKCRLFLLADLEAFLKEGCDVR